MFRRRREQREERVKALLQSEEIQAEIERMGTILSADPGDLTEEDRSFRDALDMRLEALKAAAKDVVPDLVSRGANPDEIFDYFFKEFGQGDLASYISHCVWRERLRDVDDGELLAEAARVRAEERNFREAQLAILRKERERRGLPPDPSAEALDPAAGFFAEHGRGAPLEDEDDAARLEIVMRFIDSAAQGRPRPRRKD